MSAPGTDDEPAPDEGAGGESPTDESAPDGPTLDDVRHDDLVDLVAGRDYVVAVSRRHRDEIPGDWKDQVRAVPGIDVVDGPSPERAQVHASDAAIEAVRRRFGAALLVEPLIEHHPLAPPP